MKARAYPLYLLVLALRILAGGRAVAQTLAWESTYPTSSYAGTWPDGHISLSDTMMVFAGSSAEFGKTDATGRIYSRACLLWVRPDNARAPRISLLPCYYSPLALWKENGALHGLAIDRFPARPGARRAVYFSFSHDGVLRNTIFFEPPAGLEAFSCASVLGPGRVVIGSQADVGSGINPWVGLFDVNTFSWVWQKRLPGASNRNHLSGVWSAQQAWGGRVLITGNQGGGVFYTLVDSAGPGPVNILWSRPQSDYESARAWPRPEGGWVLSTYQQFIVLDARLRQLNYVTNIHPFAMLPDGSFLATRDGWMDYQLCRIAPPDSSLWTMFLPSQPEYRAIYGALPAGNGDGVFCGYRESGPGVHDFYFCRIRDVGAFYDASLDSTRFPLTPLRKRTHRGSVLSASPNPSSGRVHVQGEANACATLRSMEGKVLLNFCLSKDGWADPDLRLLEKGVYLLRAAEQVLKVVRQ